jgi:DNA-binding response OmpR family regulator
MHILIEDEGIVQFLKQGLEEEGYEITTAFDGLQGFEVVQNTSFDLVLLDWMLPKK